jgi:hypothetical protein
MKDHYISADECAIYFGLRDKKGNPNRRGFLERLACKPGFPRPLVIGNVKTWKLSELEEWADEQRRAA